ncbi:phage antirepressor N-terminal domain-containing protein [Streptosporangium soli]
MARGAQFRRPGRRPVTTSGAGPVLSGPGSARSDDGEPLVVLKPTIEAMRLDWEPQRKKLARRSWATTSQREAVAADGKTRLMMNTREAQ